MGSNKIMIVANSELPLTIIKKKMHYVSQDKHFYTSMHRKAHRKLISSEDISAIRRSSRAHGGINPTLTNDLEREKNSRRSRTLSMAKPTIHHTLSMP